MREAFMKMLSDFDVTREEWLRDHPGESHPADVERDARREVYLAALPVAEDPPSVEPLSDEVVDEIMGSPIVPFPKACSRCNGTKWIMVGMDAKECPLCGSKEPV